MGSTAATHVPFEARSRSGIASLAMETLTSIFTWGAAAQPGHPEAFYDATALPVLISHVCRRWRSVALSTPRLWSTVFVFGFFAHPISAKSDGSESSQTTRLAETTCLRRIQVFLERSKSSPLTLYIDVRSPSWYFWPREWDHSFTVKHMSMLLDHLFPHMDRWVDVEIISDSWAHLSVFLERCSSYELSDIECGPKLLRRVALSRTNAYFTLEGARSALSNLSPSPFSNAPSLRCVTLAGVHIDWTNHCLHNLTELSLKYHARDLLPTSSELINMINSSPSLETLSIHGWGVRSFEADSTEFEGRISIRKIKRLSIGWVSAQYSIRLLSLFSWDAPNLQSIALEDVTNSLDPLSEQDSSNMLDFIAIHLLRNRDEPCLGSGVSDLTLTSVLASLDSFRCLLGVFPLLRSLTLHNVDEALLYVLDPSEDRVQYGSLLCPDLTYIVLRTAGNTSTAELQRMIQARDVTRTSMSSPTSTQSIHLETVNLLDCDTQTELSNDLEEDGFNDIVDVSELFLDEFDTLYNETYEEETPICTHPQQQNLTITSAKGSLIGDKDKRWPILSTETMSK